MAAKQALARRAYLHMCRSGVMKIAYKRQKNARIKQRVTRIWHSKRSRADVLMFNRARARRSSALFLHPCIGRASMASRSRYAARAQTRTQWHCCRG